MKNKKGFIATSLIYSFFLVFLMLMMTILVASVNNRIFVDRINEDIKSELENQGSFIVDTLPAKNYNIGESVTLANESWQVIEDKGSQVLPARLQKYAERLLSVPADIPASARRHTRKTGC